MKQMSMGRRKKWKEVKCERGAQTIMTKMNGKLHAHRNFRSIAFTQIHIKCSVQIGLCTFTKRPTTFSSLLDGTQSDTIVSNPQCVERFPPSAVEIQFIFPFFAFSFSIPHSIRFVRVAFSRSTPPLPSPPLSVYFVRTALSPPPLSLAALGKDCADTTHGI